MLLFDLLIKGIKNKVLNKQCITINIYTRRWLKNFWNTDTPRWLPIWTKLIVTFTATKGIFLWDIFYFYLRHFKIVLWSLFASDKQTFTGKITFKSTTLLFSYNFVFSFVCFSKTNKNINGNRNTSSPKPTVNGSGDLYR